MKLKKLFAALSAAMLSCCALGGTAFAEGTAPLDLTQYQMGDINLDGEVDIEDAQLALRLYAGYLARYSGDELYRRVGITAEQAKLGDIICCPDFPTIQNDIIDARLILCYYTDSLSLKTEGETISDYVRKLIQTGKCRSDLIINER